MHLYLSTACYHGEHIYCASNVATSFEGEAFHRRPAQCKFCAARCTCPCHQYGISHPADGIDAPRSTTD